MMSKAFLFAAILTAFSAAFAADPPKEDATKAEAAKLQGTWQVTKLTDETEVAAPAKEIEEWTFEFKGDQLTIRQTKDNSGHVTKYTLDPSKKPKAIDIQEADLGSEGIYKLDGDDLAICVVAGGRNGRTAARPSEFKASKPNKYSLFVLKKVKK
jgi:uncharacterized protein (TIGR03067 family)